VTGDAARHGPRLSQSEHRGAIDAMLDAAALAAAQRADSAAAVAPLRFVPGAAKSAGLIFRGDATSLALSVAADLPTRSSTREPDLSPTSP